MNKEGCHFYKLLHCCHCGLISEGPQHWLLWGLNLNLYDTPAWLGVWGDTLLGFLKWTLLPKALSLSVRQSTVQLCGTLFRGNCTNAPDLRDDWFSHWAAKSLTIMDVVKPVLTGWAVVALQASSDIFTLWAKGHATEEEDKASEGKKGKESQEKRSEGILSIWSPWGSAFLSTPFSSTPCTNLASGRDKKESNAVAPQTSVSLANWLMQCTVNASNEQILNYFLYYARMQSKGIDSQLFLVCTYVWH